MGEPALVGSTSPRRGEKVSYYSAVCLETGEVEVMELEGNSKPMPVVRAVQIRLTHVWSPACKLTVSRVSGSRPVSDWCVLPGQQHGPEVLRLHYW